MRWLTWLMRRRPAVTAVCRRCQGDLATCTRCDGDWFGRSCAHCTSGVVCALHRTNWF